MATTVVNVRDEAFDVYIGRPSKWGNPFRIGKNGTRSEVIAQYKRWLFKQPRLLSQIPELTGKKLGCYCKPQQCHGDILAELADWPASALLALINGQ